VARLVDEVMRRISAANPRLDSERLAVLTALNLAEELHRLRKEYEDLFDLLDERTQAPVKP
jgi:cell division protein ZapA